MHGTLIYRDVVQYLNNYCNKKGALNFRHFCRANETFQTALRNNIYIDVETDIKE